MWLQLWSVFIHSPLRTSTTCKYYPNKNKHPLTQLLAAHHYSLTIFTALTYLKKKCLQFFFSQRRNFEKWAPEKQRHIRDKRPFSDSLLHIKPSRAQNKGISGQKKPPQLTVIGDGGINKT